VLGAQVEIREVPPSVGEPEREVDPAVARGARRNDVEFVARMRNLWAGGGPRGETDPEIAIAEHLRRASPDAFAVLTRTPVPFRYRSKDAELYAERPLIQLSCSGEVSAVHYNSRSIAPLQLTAREAGPFYSAYRRFAALLRDPQFHLQIRLRDRDLTVFDNQRTLHGRTAFSSARHPRHLRGCYLTRDSVYSAAGLLQREFHQDARR